MSKRNTMTFTYDRFTQFPDRPVTVARLDQTDVVKTFCFQDDVWPLLNILRPHERNYDGTIRFFEIPAWLKHDAKLYVSHLWLETEALPNVICQVMVMLRHLGRTLPDFIGKPIDLRMQHARQFARKHSDRNLSATSNQMAAIYINKFMIFVRQQHPQIKDNDFMIMFPEAKTPRSQFQPLEQPMGAQVPTHLIAKIIDACVADVQAYLDAKDGYIDSIEKSREYSTWYARERRRRKRAGLPLQLGRHKILKDLLSRAIKAQATILDICVGRRIAAVCNTKVDVRVERIEWVNDLGQKEKCVMVRFREMKIKNVDEDVPCPDAFGELAEHAIATARELTSELRADNPQLKDFLFLVPGKKRRGALVLTPVQVNNYLNGDGKNPGLLSRYKITDEKITSRQFRKKRATIAYLGGLKVQDVSYDLGHTSVDMTMKHYIAGSRESRRRLQLKMEKGGLKGALKNFLGGIKSARASHR